MRSRVFDILFLLYHQDQISKNKDVHTVFILLLYCVTFVGCKICAKILLQFAEHGEGTVLVPGCECSSQGVTSCTFDHQNMLHSSWSIFMAARLMLPKMMVVSETNFDKCNL